MKASKCQLIVKDEKLGEAQNSFANTGDTIKPGARVLGSVIGKEFESKNFLEFQQNEQIKILKKLTKSAKTSALKMGGLNIKLPSDHEIMNGLRKHH